MAWVKLDDGFPNNPKVAGVSLRARWLHVVALCYCGRNLTDGALTERAVRVVVAEADVPKKHVDELHHAGLWNRAGDGYLINDYLEYNPSADDVREQKRMRAEAGRLGGIRSGMSRRGEANGQANGQASAEANASLSASKQNAKQKLKPGGSTPSRPVEELKPLAVESEFERLLRASRAAKP